MSVAVAAIIAENIVLLAGIGAGWHLLRQGGGVQVKAPPVQKKTPQATEQAANVQTFGRAS
jgi:hypothetical protein